MVGGANLDGENAPGADVGVPPETCRSRAETILKPKGNFLAETQGEESTHGGPSAAGSAVTAWTRSEGTGA
jgi:hypothetical protein